MRLIFYNIRISFILAKEKGKLNYTKASNNQGENELSHCILNVYKSFTF